jgi:hypothetical protein
MPNTVQNQLAAGILNKFHVTLGLNLQGKLQDWPSRQDTQYGAMKGLMNKDWHGLKDFKIQMTLYSSTHHLLMIAWQVIKSIVPNNATILATLTVIPGFGQVGKQLLSLIGIRNILVAPQDILKSRSQFNSTISSVDTTTTTPSGFNSSRPNI